MVWLPVNFCDRVVGWAAGKACHLNGRWGWDLILLEDWDGMGWDVPHRPGMFLPAVTGEQED